MAAAIRTRRHLLAGGLATLPLALACSQPAGNTPKPVATAGPVTLEMAWENLNNEMGAFVNGQAKQIFEQRHPGWTLNFAHQGNDRAKFLAQVSAGTPSHVLHFNSNLATFYVLQGVLAPLDPFIQKDKDAKQG